MTIGTPQIDLFALAERRLGWIDSRQHVLAQNIANADTPGYRARDLAAFSAVLGGVGVTMSRTSPLHLAGLRSEAAGARPGESERAPDGNAVVLEDEMTKVADGENAQALAGNIWHSYMGMFMTALGHGG